MTVAMGNRNPSAGRVLLFGAALGAACFLLAEALVPRDVSTPGQHDLWLANRIGFVYPPLVGAWLGWLQRSPPRVLLGALLGVLIGTLYLWFCDRDFLAVMVAFPCLLGGVFAALAGSNRDPWLAGLPARLGKGLVAGFVLGVVYMAVLTFAAAGCLIGHTDEADYTSRYVATMWTVGPWALGLASGPFLIVLRWAVGLSDVGSVVRPAVSGAGKRQERPAD